MPIPRKKEAIFVDRDSLIVLCSTCHKFFVSFKTKLVMHENGTSFKFDTDLFIVKKM